MKIQTKELTGTPLDWAVAWCESKTITLESVSAMGNKVGTFVSVGERDEFGVLPYTPSTDWAQGGPLKEREGIVSGPSVKGDFFAFKPMKGADSIRAFGPTELIAVTRCYVTSKLGDVVEVPDYLA